MNPSEENDHHLADALQSGRPAPRRAFGEGLRERLLEQDALKRRPAQLWLLVTAYACAGLLLLVIAAITAGGGGL